MDRLILKGGRSRFSVWQGKSPHSSLWKLSVRLKSRVYESESLLRGVRTALRLEYEGYKCSSTIIIQILSIAAARWELLFAACRDLANAPPDPTIRNALELPAARNAHVETLPNRQPVRTLSIFRSIERNNSDRNCSFCLIR